MSAETLQVVVGILSALVALVGAVFSSRARTAEREADKTAQRALEAHDAASLAPPSSREELVERVGSIGVGALRRNPELTQKILSDIDELRSTRRGEGQDTPRAE